MHEYEETKFNDNNDLTLINEMISMFTDEIQKDYISKYLVSFPPSKSYEKIKENFSEKPTRNIVELYDVDEQKLNINNVCKFNKENIHCFIGNVNLQQLANGFSDGFENALDLLDKDTTINKPFGKGKIDLLKYISIIASRDASELNKYDTYLKNQIGKDMRRDVLIINNYDISRKLRDNEILKYFFSGETIKMKQNNENALELTNNDCTNIVALLILGELNEKLRRKLSMKEMYDKLMLLLTLLHQGIPGEIQLLLENYTRKIVDKINLEVGDDNLYTININSPEVKDDSINYKEYNNSNKYIKLIIDENEISLYSVIYTRFMFDGNIETYRDGHYFAVLHMDVLNQTYEIKYLTIDINYVNYNYNPTKFEKFKETISENKGSTAAGTLLTLGALSAVPIALLLGGKESRRLRRIGRKQRRIKTHKRRQRKTRNKKNKKYNNNNKKYNNKNKKHKTLKK
jgi:hypothetical protein